MSLPHRAPEAQGFTRTDILIALATVGVLSSVLLPCLAIQRSSSDRLTCVNNLRRIGRAFLLAAEESRVGLEPQFPFRTSLSQGGSLGSAQVSLHLAVLSNYLESPVLMSCPSSTRTNATSFRLPKDIQVSYALGTHALPLNPGQILMADGDIEGGSPAICELAGRISTRAFSRTPGQPGSLDANWSATNHVRMGQVLLSDGAVLTTDSKQLRGLISAEGFSDTGETHLLLPR